MVEKGRIPLELRILLPGSSFPVEVNGYQLSWLQISG